MHAVIHLENTEAGPWRLTVQHGTSPRLDLIEAGEVVGARCVNRENRATEVAFGNLLDPQPVGCAL